MKNTESLIHRKHNELYSFEEFGVYDFVAALLKKEKKSDSKSVLAAARALKDITGRKAGHLRLQNALGGYAATRHKGGRKKINKDAQIAFAVAKFVFEQLQSQGRHSKR